MTKIEILNWESITIHPTLGQDIISQRTEKHISY